MNYTLLAATLVVSLLIQAGSSVCLSFQDPDISEKAAGFVPHPSVWICLNCFLVIRLGVHIESKHTTEAMTYASQ